MPLCTLTLESHMCIFVRGAFVIGLLLMDLKTLALNDSGVLKLGSFCLILLTASSSKMYTFKEIYLIENAWKSEKMWP